MTKKNRKKTNRNHQHLNRKRVIQQFYKLYNRGDYDKSLEILNNITHDLDEGRLFFLKAQVLYKQGKVRDVLILLNQTLELNPENIEYLSFAAQFLEENNQSLQSLTLYSKIFKLRPQNISVLKKMGMLLERIGRFEQALICYKKFLTFKKDDPVSTRQIGVCYYNLGNLNKAADYYEKAITLGGNTCSTWVLIGGLFLSKGDRENASQAFKKAIDIDGNYYPAYPQYIKSTDLSQSLCKELIDKLKDLLHFHASEPFQKRICHFSLGELYHKLENYLLAMRNYKLGNKYRAVDVGTFAIDPLISRLKWCRKHIERDLYVNKLNKTSGTMSQPVFVVGMPRSGTTLLEQIIASHKQGAGAGELTTIKNIIDDIGGSGDFNNEFLGTIKGLTPGDIEKYREKYLSELRRSHQEAIRIVDKMPHNLLHVWMIGLLFPEAPILHCDRNPLDTCLSCFITDFNDSHTYKENLYKLGQYYSVYSHFIEIWKEVVPNPIMRVKYEELVDHPESITREIIAHIGLEWDPNCLQLRDTEHFSRTASNLQIRKGIYKTSIKRWQKYEKYLDELKQGLQNGMDHVSKASG